MPTKHARIAILRDDEVDAALRSAARALGEGRPTASLARELILRGAKTVEPDPRENPDAYLAARGVRPATGTLAELRAKHGRLPPFDPRNSTPANDALTDLRADRV